MKAVLFHVIRLSYKNLVNAIIKRNKNEIFYPFIYVKNTISFNGLHLVRNSEKPIFV